MNDIDANFKIVFDNFSGSIEELIKKIRENLINIDEVPATKIINQCLEYILKNKNTINLDIISKTVSDAATILKMKSEYILPSIEDKNNEEDEDIDKSIFSEDRDTYLREYGKYQEVVKYLKKREEKENDIYFPIIENKYKDDNIEIQKVELSDLLASLEKVLQNKKKDKFIPIKKRAFTIDGKMKEINILLKNSNEELSFDYFMKTAQSKLEIIAIFLALLELIHLNKISCYQDNAFGKIHFNLKGDALNSKKN
jgi:segregation and condensation protein A